MEFQPKAGPDPRESSVNVSDWETKDYYQRLGVPRNASKEEINKAFRKVSLQYHPDKEVGNEEMRAKYDKIQALLSEAKTALTDPAKRAKYDRETGVRATPANAEADFYSHMAKDIFEDEPEENEYKAPVTEKQQIEQFVSVVMSMLGDRNPEELAAEKRDLVLEEGVDVEELTKALEEKLLPYFSNYVKNNRGDSREDAIIERMRKNLVALGINSQLVNKTLNNAL